jgi:low molecular weight protein-tyrosine phosphatase
MRRIVEEASLRSRFEIESAGTAAYHVGELPDARSREAAGRRGIQLNSRARQFVASDFDDFDFVLAMDRENLANLRALPGGPKDPGRLALLRSFDPDSPSGAGVPDPYYGGEGGFEDVLDLCDAACRGLLQHILVRTDFD